VGKRYSIPQKTPSGSGSTLEGAGAPVPLVDLAPGRWTAQSSASPTKVAGYTRPTEPELAPFWAIDLGAVFALRHIQAELAPLPPGTAVRLYGYTIPTKDDGPPVGSCIFACTARELPMGEGGSAVLARGLDGVARFLYIELVAAGGEPVVLALRGLTIFGASPFGASLLESYERAFALFAPRPLFCARPTPDAPFETTHTYAQVWDAANALGRALAARLEPGAGERIFVGLATRTRAEWLVAEIACLIRGYVVVPLAPTEPEDRLRAIVLRCALDAVVCEAEQAPLFRRLLRPGALVVPHDTFDELAMGAPVDVPDPQPRGEDDLFTVLFTSGSTGVPKGAMRSYRKCNALLQSYGVPQPAVHLSFQPLSHLSERHYWPALVVNGGTVGLSRGGPHVLSDLRALEPSWVSSVPRLFDVVRAGAERAIAAAKAEDPLRDEGAIEAGVLARTRESFGRKLQGVATGSAPVSPETWQFLQRCFGDIWVADGYGSTEVGTITGNRQVPAGVEVKLAPVPGLELLRGQGEILVRSPHAIDGYFGDPTASAAAFSPDGFFRTGDIGEHTPDGLRIVGRVANTVKLGQGEFVSLEQVEAALGAAPVVDRVVVQLHPGGASLVALVVPKAEELARLLGAPVAELDVLCNDWAAEGAVLGALREHGARAGLAGRTFSRSAARCRAGRSLLGSRARRCRAGPERRKEARRSRSSWPSPRLPRVGRSPPMRGSPAISASTASRPRRSSRVSALPSGDRCPSRPGSRRTRCTTSRRRWKRRAHPRARSRRRNGIATAPCAFPRGRSWPVRVASCSPAPPGSSALTFSKSSSRKPMPTWCVWCAPAARSWGARGFARSVRGIAWKRARTPAGRWSRPISPSPTRTSAAATSTRWCTQAPA
jgi:long-subunit acyl-CoA synthetase (AMP-forming)